MKIRFYQYLLGFFLLQFSVFSLALTPAQLAGDFKYHEAKISPDGKHIALTLIHGGKRRLAVVDAKTFKSVGGANFGDRQEVGPFYWVSDKRLVIKVLHHEPWEEEPRYYGELYAVDYDGKRGKLIYGYRAGEMSTGTKIKKTEATIGFADIVSLLPDEDNYILISSKPANVGMASPPTLHRLNVRNGRKSSIVATGPSRYAEFIADKDGNVRLAVTRDKDFDKQVFVFNDKDKTWSELSDDQFGDGFNPLAIDDSGKKLFVVDDLNQDKTGLFSIDLKTGKRKEIYTDKNVDIAGVVFNEARDNVYAVRTEDGYPAQLMFNKKSEEAQVYRELLNAFKGYRVRITSNDDDGNLWLVHAENDLNFGSYYLYNREKKSFSLLFDNFAKLDKKALSESIPISFAASDGQKVHGYITYPVSVDESQAVPLVVLVHGGPHGVRDYWDFDREVQLLSSQGYAVLRVNYRGSGGYGKAYEQAGHKKWGGRIQQDIIDATQWVIAQGGIDQNKVCIMGASFGAYSAVQSATMAPDLFKCVVANAGVYDLNMMFKKGDIPKAVWGEAFLEMVLGVDEEKLRAFSPVNNLASLKAPVFIAHGARDRRAPIEQAEALKAGMEKLGKPYEWFVKSTETHGFYDQANRTEYFENVAKFLAKYLK